MKDGRRALRAAGAALGENGRRRDDEAGALAAQWRGGRKAAIFGSRALMMERANFAAARNATSRIATAHSRSLRSKARCAFAGGKSNRASAQRRLHAPPSLIKVRSRGEEKRKAKGKSISEKKMTIIAASIAGESRRWRYRARIVRINGKRHRVTRQHGARQIIVKIAKMSSAQMNIGRALLPLVTNRAGEKAPLPLYRQRRSWRWGMRDVSNAAATLIAAAAAARRRGANEASQRRRAAARKTENRYQRAGAFSISGASSSYSRENIETA